MSKWHPLRHLLLATSALVPLGLTAALANPLGGTVVGGGATISGGGTSNVIVNQHTDRAIINWQTFNIGSGDSVRFNQPGSGSIALNRVTGGMGPSSINGVLDANGRVFLVNPDGLLIGRGASINTAGFLATTSDISNESFMAGRYQFNIAGRPDASIVNLGTINSHSHGFAALVAPGVRNSGTITARFGTIGLASANTFSLDFYGDELIKLSPGDAISSTVRDVETGLPLNALVKNEGLLRANGGRVELTAAAARTVVDSVINNTGVIEARSVGHRNGKIVLGGATGDNGYKQTVKVSGRLDVSSRKAKGGKIQVTGQHINVTAASFDASGPAGGGTVLIGGDTGGGHGHWATDSIPQAGLEPGAVPNATTVSIDAGTVINASATSTGNGGKVIVWADGSTSFAGHIFARGGDAGGNGGFVEVSGKETLDFRGVVNTSAPFGSYGTLLLDPGNLTIQNGGGSSFTGSDTANSTLDVAILNNALISNNVVVATGMAPGFNVGDIIVNAPIVWNTSTTLTLSAYRNIQINDTGLSGTIRNTGSGNLVLRADSTGIGIGTIVMNPSTNSVRVDWLNSTGNVTVYYNPSNYSSPTVFTSGNGRFNLASSSQLQDFMLVNSIANLQGIAANTSGRYALGSDINANGATMNGLTFTFQGVFDGLGHTISNLNIIGPSALATNAGIIRNLNLTNFTVSAGGNNQFIGLLVGHNLSGGQIIDVDVSGTVNGGSFNGLVAGGLVGMNAGLILNSSSSANLTSAGIGVTIGGLAGSNADGAFITDSFATGNVTASGNVPATNCNPQCQNVIAGGLVGMNMGTIRSVNLLFATFASGNVFVGSNGTGGGLVGSSSGIITGAMASGAVTGAAGTGRVGDSDRSTNLGGLVGNNFGLVEFSSATGDVGSPNVDNLTVGGFVGDNSGLIALSTSTGDVFAGRFSTAGGFAGANEFMNCINCSSSGVGMAYFNAATLASTISGGSVMVGSDSVAGGFVGVSEGDIFSSFAVASVTGGANSIIGGFAGVNDIYGVILYSGAFGTVTGTGANGWVGGFAGVNGGIIESSVFAGDVKGATNSAIGGFAGMNIGSIYDSGAVGTVNSSGGGNVIGGFAGANFGTLDSVFAAGSIEAVGANIVGGLVGANATFVNLNPDLPFSSFPAGTIVNSTTEGTMSSGAGSITGVTVGVQNPRTLPGFPGVIGTCDATLCSYFNNGVLGGATSDNDQNKVPDEILAIPAPVWSDRTQPQTPEVLIKLTDPAPTSPPSGGPAGGTTTPRLGSQVPGTPPSSLAPPPAYIRDNGIPSGLPAIGETRFNQSQVLVQFPANVTQAQLNRIAQQFGLTILSTSNAAGGVTVQFQLGGQQTVRNAIRALERLRELGTVQPNYSYRVVQADQTVAQATPQAIPPTATTVSRGDPAQYMMGKLNLSDAHRVASGSNVLVAVIDSEVDREHAELAGTIVERFDATDSPTRAHSHGTAMAGAIVSRDRLLGVAPGARILAIRAFSETQTTAESTSLTILKSIEWAVSRGARVINMSFAGPYDPALAQALKDAAAKGVILIAASGNAGPKSPPLWPSADPNVIAVTATDSSDRLFRQANRGPYVSVASPGVEILAPAPQAGYQMSTGTSIATAHVSGMSR